VGASRATVSLLVSSSFSASSRAVDVAALVIFPTESSPRASRAVAMAVALSFSAVDTASVTPPLVPPQPVRNTEPATQTARSVGWRAAWIFRHQIGTSASRLGRPARSIGIAALMSAQLSRNSVELELSLAVWAGLLVGICWQLAGCSPPCQPGRMVLPWDPLEPSCFPGACSPHNLPLAR
jgi:hypothetical protein